MEKVGNLLCILNKTHTYASFIIAALVTVDVCSLKTLLVDIGNSRIKWAVGDKSGLQSIGVQEHRGKRFGVKFAPWAEISGIDRVLVSNVAGERMEKYCSRWCSNQWELEPEYILSQKRKHRVINAYDDAVKLGADRWAALVAVRATTNMASCIVDCGTAVTFDVMEGNGAHLGGLIIPGPELTQEMLIKQTNISEAGVGDPPQSLLGSDTGTCISGGAYYAIVATMDRMVADLQQELGLGIKLIMTGGNAEKIAMLASDDWDVKPHLVLEGLLVMAKGKK